MSLVDSLLNVMHMNPDDDEDYYDDYYDEEDEEEPAPKRRRQAKEPEESGYKSGANANQPIDINRNRERPAPKSSSKVTPMRPSSKKATSSGMEVCVIKPISFEDAREITEALLMNRPVILNVEGLDVDIAQRIIDFASGSCFAISGNLQKISNYIFIITPANVDISGDFQNFIDSYDQTSIRMEY